MRILLTILCLFVVSCDSPTEPFNSYCDDGFSPIIGYSDYWGNECYSDYDIKVLEDFIANSSSTINYNIELNNNDVIEWYELGHQEWQNGRLIAFSSYFTYTDYPDVYYNTQLSGDIPESITNWQYIKDLRLGLSRFDGMLTGEIDILGNLITLEKLSIQNNDFDSVDIPENIYNLINLKTLYLGMNSFTGQVSSNISNLVNLEWFWVGGNELSGELPDELWNLPNIYEITVEDNNFTGAIPEYQIGQLNNLYYLNLQNNNFHSAIPSSICLLENLIGSLGMIDEYYSEFIGENYYYFNIENNYFCPDPNTLQYPICIANYIGTQNTAACEGDGVYSNYSVDENIQKRNNIKILSKPLK